MRAAVPPVFRTSFNPFSGPKTLTAVAKSDAEREYGLACYFLTSNGLDLIGSRAGGTPGDWWAGYDTDLGAALGPRGYFDSGRHRREFEGGFVYVVEPGGKPWDLGNGRTLQPREGAVVLYA